MRKKVHIVSYSSEEIAAMRKLLERTRAVGEPIITGLHPMTLAAELGTTDWTLIEQLDAAEIDRRYFATRNDGYQARPMVRLTCAGVL